MSTKVMLEISLPDRVNLGFHGSAKKKKKLTDLKMLSYQALSRRSWVGLPGKTEVKCDTILQMYEGLVLKREQTFSVLSSKDNIFYLPSLVSWGAVH